MSENPPADTSAASDPAESLPPLVIEGARSSRSKCKGCRRAIQKDTLRLGILFEGPYGTGYLWHHLTCAARKRPDELETLNIVSVESDRRIERGGCAITSEGQEWDYTVGGRFEKLSEIIRESILDKIETREEPV